MLRILLRPRWLAVHLAAVLVVAGCLTAAYWQFEAAREPARDALPVPEELDDPVDIAAVSSPGEYLPTEDANQAVSAIGRYDLGNQLYTPGRSAGGEPGFYVVTPLLTGEDTAVAVNRGWLPAETVEEGTEPSAPDGEITAVGWLTPPQQEPAEGYSAVAVPEGHIERIAPAVLVNQWPYQVFEGHIILAEQTPEAPQGGPAAAPPTETPEKYQWNLRSLSYSGQWALFGVVAGAFWLSLMRREISPPREAPPAPPDEPAAENGLDQEPSVPSKK